MRSHHGCSCGGGLRGHSRLVGLVLRRLDLGLQVRRRVEVLALLARAAALDIVHADGDRVVAGVDHGAVARVGEAAVRLAAGAVAALELAADLRGEVADREKMWTDTWMFAERRGRSTSRHAKCEILERSVHVSKNANNHINACTRISKVSHHALMLLLQ